MPIADTPLRGRLARGAALLALAGAMVAPNAANAQAPANSNNIDCRGSLKASPDKDPLGLNENLVAYRFACSQPITGYSLTFPSHELDFVETEVFGSDRATGAVVGTDSFSCNGNLPGYGINCVGSYAGNYDVLNGTVNFSTQKLCAEPRVEVLATVFFASATVKAATDTAPASATVTQAAAGPFSLGRPHGCPKSPGKKTLFIPKTNDTSADTPGEATAGPLGKKRRRAAHKRSH